MQGILQYFNGVDIVDGIQISTLNSNTILPVMIEYIMKQGSLETEQNYFKTNLCNPDAQLVKLMKKFDFEQPRWKCSSGGEITSCCISQGCKAKDVFRCVSICCSPCQTIHQDCGYSVELKYITRLMQQECQKRRRAMSSVYQKQEELIALIRESRTQQIEDQYLGYLPQQSQHVAQQIFFAKKRQNVSRIKINTLIESLKSSKKTNSAEKISTFKRTGSNSSPFTRQATQNLLKLYSDRNDLQTNRNSNEENAAQLIQKSQEKTKTNVNLLEDKHFQLDKKSKTNSLQEKQAEKNLNMSHNSNEINRLVNVQKPVEVKQDEIKISSFPGQVKVNNIQIVLPQSENSFNIEVLHKSKRNRLGLKILDKQFQNSQILNLVTYKEKEFVIKCLEYPKDLRLVFRASQQGFRANKFHQLCDKVPNTFTLLRNEYGYIIGAYTPLRWSEGVNNGYIEDRTKKSFIMSLNTRQKMSLVNQKRAIMRCSNAGPIFGSKYDLKISNECHQNRQSFIKLNKSYHNLKKISIGEDEDELQKRSGNKQGNFRVQEYEVFQVIV